MSKFQPCALYILMRLSSGHLLQLLRFDISLCLNNKLEKYCHVFTCLLIYETMYVCAKGT